MVAWSTVPARRSPSGGEYHSQDAVDPVCPSRGGMRRPMAIALDGAKRIIPRPYSIGQAGEAMAAALAAAGETMSAEWLGRAGDAGAAIVEAYQAAQ